MTFSDDPAFVKPVVAMMMGSRETAVDYMTPLGLAHQMATSHHYGPGPWVDDAGRADWNPVYFSQAGKDGIGFDRTPSGSNAVAQYAPPLAAQFSDPHQTPERLFLWFHHEPWSYQMKSGRTLWDELVLHYAHGVENVGKMNESWAKLKPYVDAERFQLTADFLRRQQEDAKIWRDASIAYFQSLSGLPLPAGVASPEHTLDYYKALRQPFAPGSPGKTASPFRND
jgi:alpha-glucuronidase